MRARERHQMRNERLTSGFSSDGVARTKTVNPNREKGYLLAAEGLHGVATAGGAGRDEACDQRERH